MPKHVFSRKNSMIRFLQAKGYEVSLSGDTHEIRVSGKVIGTLWGEVCNFYPNEDHDGNPITRPEWEKDVSEAYYASLHKECEETDGGVAI